MSRSHRISKIIDAELASLRAGLETPDTVLEKYPKDASALRLALEAAYWLAEAGYALEPRPGYIASSRKYLEQKLATLPRPSIWRRLLSRYSPQRWVINLFSPVVLILLLVLVVNSLVLSARLSIPGEPLYPAKLAIEDVHLLFTLNPEEKTDLFMQYSRERTTEFVELVLNSDYQQLPAAAGRMEAEMVSTLQSLNNLAVSDPSAERPMVASLRDALANEIIMLNMLKQSSPSYARSGIELAIEVAQTGVIALH